MRTVDANLGCVGRIYPVLHLPTQE